MRNGHVLAKGKRYTYADAFADDNTELANGNTVISINILLVMTVWKFSGVSNETWISYIPQILISFQVIAFIFSILLLLIYIYQTANLLEKTEMQFETLSLSNLAHFLLLGKFRHLKVMGLELKRILVLRVSLALLISLDYLYLLAHLEEYNQGWDQNLGKSPFFKCFQIFNIKMTTPA